MNIDYKRRVSECQSSDALFYLEKIKKGYDWLIEKEKIIIPVWRKVTMTVEEAAAYSSIGINKIREMLKIPNCPFVLYIGNKKLVKRREFENYIEGNIEL